MGAKQALIRTAAIVGVVALLGYWSTLQAPLSGDATTHVYLAHSFLADRDADLSEFADAPQPFVFNFRSAPGGLYAPYLPGNALLFVPFEVAAIALAVEPVSVVNVAVLPKLAASLAVALSVALVFLTLQRVTRERTALFLTFAYAFGTAAFATASQRYWQHGPILALIAATLYVLVRGGGARAGLLIGLAVLVRPATGLFGLAVLALVVHRRRASLLAFLGWGVAPLAFLLIYDTRVFGSPFHTGIDTVPLGTPLGGLLGLLVSPSRGLLVYAPFLAIALAALAASWVWPADDVVWILRYGSIATAATIVLYSCYAEWIGGWGFGDRYLSDLLPLYFLAIAVAWDRWLRDAWPRRIFAVAVAWGVLLQASAAGVYYFFWDGTHWDATPDIGLTPERVWSWTDAQWEWVLARVILAPPATIAIEALALLGCVTVFAALGRRCA